MGDEEIIKMGHMLKQGHMFKNWKMRHFKLTKETLTYGHATKGVRGTIQLQHIKTIQPHVDAEGRSVLFEIKSVIKKKSSKSKTCKDFLILCKDSKEREEWIGAIQKARDDRSARDGQELFHDIKGRHGVDGRHVPGAALEHEFKALQHQLSKANDADCCVDLFNKLHHFFNSPHNKTTELERSSFQMQFDLLRGTTKNLNAAIWTPTVESHFNRVQVAAKRESSFDLLRGQRSRMSISESPQSRKKSMNKKMGEMMTPLPPELGGRSSSRRRKDTSTPRAPSTTVDVGANVEGLCALLVIHNRMAKAKGPVNGKTALDQVMSSRILDFLLVLHGRYELLKEIGHGTFATVYKALKVGTTEIFAVKRVDKRKLNEDDVAALRTEVAIMLKLNHPNIVALHETFESDHFFDLVMENCVGGELFQRLVSRKTYPEAEARDVVRSVCNAVAYCHRRNVVHRDLKPENLLYADTSDNAPIKIADFGFAQKVRCAGLATDCGSPWYVAPEILTGIRYEAPVDMWSIGVIAYILLCGYPPFRDENQVELFIKIREVQYEFDSPYWDDISEDAKNFVSMLLQGDPKNRLTAAEALQHCWLAEGKNDGLNVGVQGKLTELTALRDKSIKIGMLEKKGRMNREYQPREFMLHPSRGLIYTDNWTVKGDINLKRILKVSHYSDNVKKERHARSFCVHIQGGRQYVLRAETLELKKDWMECIVNAIEFNSLLMKAEDSLQTNKLADAMEHAAEARRTKGFGESFVSTRLWAQLAEHPKIAFAGCTGVHESVSFRQIHSGPIACVACSHGSGRPRRAITGGNDKLVILWDPLTGSKIFEMKGHATAVKAVAISENETAISGGADGTLHAWNLKTGSCLWCSRRTDGHTEAIAALAVTPDGEWAVSGSWDKLLTVWAMEQGRAVIRLMGHKLAITAVAISDDGAIAVSGGVDKRIMVWDLVQQKRLRQFKGHKAGIRSIALGRRFVPSEGGVEERSAEERSAEERVVLSGAENGELKVWGLDTGKSIATLMEAEDPTNPINDVSLSRDGRVAVTASEDQTIRVWDMGTNKQLTQKTMPYKDQEVSSLAFCGNGGLFVVSHENQNAMWSIDWTLEHKGRRYGINDTGAGK